MAHVSRLSVSYDYDETTQLDGNMTTVHNFYRHWFTNIDVRRYPDDMNILPTNNSISIANCSNAQMKYLPEKSVEKLLKTMLYIVTNLFI